MQNSNPNANPEILTLDDLAEMLGVQPKTVYNWRNKNISLPRTIKIPGIRGVRYLRSDINDWLKQHYVAEPQPTKRRGRPRKTTTILDTQAVRS